jgi:hypothetical protein
MTNRSPWAEEDGVERHNGHNGKDVLKIAEDVPVPHLRCVCGHAAISHIGKTSRANSLIRTGPPSAGPCCVHCCECAGFVFPASSHVRRVPDRPKEGDCPLCGFEPCPGCDEGIITHASGVHRCKHRLAYEAENPLRYDSVTGSETPDGKPYRRMPGGV